MSAKFLLACAILFVAQQIASGLNCYQCGAGSDGCGTSFNSKGAGVVQIAQTASTAGCQKQVSNSNPNSITRVSSANCLTTGVTTSTGVDGYTAYCCTTDLCNGTPMKSASITLALTVAALSFFYMM